jgi:hypothetical protein
MSSSALEALEMSIIAELQAREMEASEALAYAQGKGHMGQWGA